MESPATVTIANEALLVTCTPAHGFSLSSLVDRASGAEALWRRPGFLPAPCTRALGPSGAASEETFLDVFCGGWFEMFPEVGYTREGDIASFVHGEAVRLPWELLDCGPDRLAARVATVRRPLVLERTVALEGPLLRVGERVENVGRSPVPYSWGHHPCFSRETFAGGRLEVPVAAAAVPAPWFDPDHATLAHGPFAWPQASARDDGGAVDLSVIPPAADGRHDHACLTLAGGSFRLTAPSAGDSGRALRVTFDADRFPWVLLWECFGAGAGAPFWAGCDALAVEFSTIPGRSTPDAIAAGALLALAPGEAVETEWTVGWEAL